MSMRFTDWVIEETEEEKDAPFSEEEIDRLLNAAHCPSLPLKEIIRQLRTRIEELEKDLTTKRRDEDEGIISGQ